ncbi:exodeoxyribonuclease VII large subunit [Roseofilum reptotaenium CS-1145]|uniref:Exodeoxyribonuclease 7 large subunit n=1 Tax=Roseofilum reptotaenium AO1-A TaxID=1925591 RepID=A0A1L9QW45_9CYAN|nr:MULTISPECIES: exodeoxyribonuclease VII large subunit [Roseofilum]MBP0027768.1 exodeoxyribonuclease VII large subunit [Roseofilum sp. Guam]MDB9518014.1 exodeoxyribonuclease VII large subunit [Roseofilum reptotaenium CS-1145]OJJ26900.1 exodeoxyribonuclease VII large subunit [Roseofilum reptotaenium AO1-A]
MTFPLPNLLVPERAVSVNEFTRYLQMRLEGDERLQQIWVTGEVSSASQYSSGLFFTLQDPEVKASLNCVVWNNALSRLMTQPTAGAKIVVLGTLRIYPPRGQYQLMVYQVLPGGEGLQALRYRQLRDRLAAEGYFDPDRKQPIPSHPNIVAVITSRQAAAWGDIQRTLKRRYPGLHVLFCPALVQGEQSPSSIVRAIQQVESDGRAEVIILARGGGATEDLAAFNDERVVKAIAECPIPIISGIGHQRDESLADLAADLYVHTPTAAANRAVPELSTLLNEHEDRCLALIDVAHTYFNQHQHQLNLLRNRLYRLQLDRQITQEEQTLDWKRRQLIQLSLQALQQQTQKCDYLRQKLSTLDPHNVLKRGYALVRSENGEIVRSVSSLKSDQELSIGLGQGQVKVKIVEILP